MSFEARVQQILTFYRQRRRMPSFSEIAAMTGLRSKNAVSKLVRKMMAQGLMAKDARGRLIPTHLLSELRFVGLVEAGVPSPADDELFETMNLEAYLVRKPEATYLLRVRGIPWWTPASCPAIWSSWSAGRSPMRGTSSSRRSMASGP